MPATPAAFVIVSLIVLVFVGQRMRLARFGTNVQRRPFRPRARSGSLCRMRWLLQLPLVFVFLLVAWSANLYFGWLPRPNAQQRESLGVLLAPQPPLGERNAFAALWFLDR